MKIKLSDHFTYSKLLRFVFPSIIMMVFTSIYGVVDGLFVSNFAGKTAFASINLVMPFVMILGGIGFMIGTGGTALVSKVLGEGKKEKANEIFTMMIIFTLLLGALLSVIGVISMPRVADFLGATEEMMADCVIYGRIVTGFTVAFMLQNVFQSFLIAAEKPKLGLLATVLAGIANMALDAIFIIVFKFKPFAPDKNEVGNKAYSQRLRQWLLGAYEQYFLIRCQHDLQLPVDEICR